MNPSIEISEKLLHALEIRKISPEDSIESVIWNLIEDKSTNAKNDILRTYSKKNLPSIWRTKTLNDVFG